jgi:hypothetical protein
MSSAGTAVRLVDCEGPAESVHRAPAISESMKMRHFQSLILFPALLSSLALALPADAQDSRIDQTLTLTQAEHVATDLKQGMTVSEVQKLLGTPRRTALKSDGNSANKPSKGTLQWTYTWANSSVQGSLRVDFASKAPDDWYVSSWDWVNF